MRNHRGRTPVQCTAIYDKEDCYLLIKSLEAEPQRPRVMLKARALLDAAAVVDEARKGAEDAGLSLALQQEKAIAAAPAYLKGRVDAGQKLPLVALEEAADCANERLLACLEYALGLEGESGEAQGMGMLKEVFVELVRDITSIDQFKGVGGGSVMGAGITPSDPLNARKKKLCNWM